MTDIVKTAILSPQTLIPMGLLCALLIPLTAATWWAGTSYTQFTNRLTDVELAVLGKRWTPAMEQAAWFEFQRLNPEIEVPNARQIQDAWNTP